jgi:hypothetical protein
MKTQKKMALVGALMALALFAAACGGGAGSSPTATAKAFFDAAKARDADGIKNTMSKGSLELMEKFAKMQNKTLDEALKEPSSAPQAATFEAKDEKITGDTATVMVKDQKGSWESIPLVKEDGKWKIALDKAFQQGPGGPK